LINLTVSFKDYENSTKKSKFVEIDLSKLGVDEYNKIRKQNNETEIDDQQAPTSTIEDQDIKELNKEAFLKYFEENKDKLSNDEVKKISTFMFIEKLKNISLLSKDIEKEMIKKGDNYISVQNFDYDKTTLKLKHSMFAFEYTKHMVNLQNVYIFSFPKIENNKVKSIRVSIVSLQDFQNNDFSNMSSKRVNVNEKINEDKNFMQKIVLKEHFGKLVTVKYIGDKKTVDEAIKDDISKFEYKLPEELTFEKISVKKHTNKGKEYIKYTITAK
jgi:hypothetical protein